MKYTPLFCRVIAIVYDFDTKEMKTNADKNITIPSDTTFGEIIEVAKGIDESGKKIEMQVEVGDKILFKKYNAIKIETIKNASLYVINQNDILVKYKTK